MAGTLRLAADLSANLREQNGNRTVLISNLNADASANALRMNNRNLGEANFTAHTTGSTLNFQFDSDLAQEPNSRFGRFAAHAATIRSGRPLPSPISSTRISLRSSLRSRTVKPSFDALVEGQASVNGPMLNTDALTARLQLNTSASANGPAALAHGRAGARQSCHHSQQRSHCHRAESLSCADAAAANRRAGNQHRASGSANLKNTRPGGEPRRECGSQCSAGCRSGFLFFWSGRDECHGSRQLFAARW